MNRKDSLDEAKLAAPLRLAPEVKRLVTFLKETDLREHAYAELTDLVGVDVSSRGRGYRFLSKARDILWREHGMLYGCLDGEGVRRLSDEEIVRYGERVTRATGRRAGRESQRLSCADYSSLTDDQKASFNTNKMMLELIAAIPRKKLRDKLFKAAIAGNQQLATQQTLEALTR